MILTPEQQSILDGAKGEIQAKVMKTLVMYGETFGADKMVPVTSEYNHLVTSFGLKMMGPVFDLMQKLIDADAVSQQKFSVDPRPVDKNVPANFLQNLVFNKLMYTKQNFYEEQLKKLGLEIYRSRIKLKSVKQYLLGFLKIAPEILVVFKAYIFDFFVNILHIKIKKLVKRHLKK